LKRLTEKTLEPPAGDPRGQELHAKLIEIEAELASRGGLVARATFDLDRDLTQARSVVSLSLRQSDYFWADLTKQVDWYRENANPEVAERFVDAVEVMLKEATITPSLGRQRSAQWPELADVRSYRVQRPFHRLLIFYRCDSSTLFAERLIPWRA
jgi:plasmid stabilization system protein ParE